MPLSALEKNIAPGTPLGLSMLGIEILPKDDPVLTYLAQSDEREYEKMLNTDDAISGAVHQRIKGLIAAGSEIQRGRKGADAKRLHDFAITVAKAIESFTQVQEDLLHAIFYGWRPAELQWTSDLRFEGQLHWGVERVVVRDPWKYSLTPDGAVVSEVESMEMRVYSSEIDRLRWLVARAGSTSSAYGRAELRQMWLVYFLSKKFENMSSKVMQRALGILKATHSGPSTGAEDNKALASLKTILDRLNSHNVLMESQGWTVDLLTDVSIPESMPKILDWMDKKKRIRLVGQNLTSEAGKVGSYAAVKGHSKILESFWKSDAKALASWINEGLLHRIIELNFGEVDPDDLPRWKSKAFSKPDLEAVRAMFDMGARIDARRMAESYNVPLADDEDDSALSKEPGESMLPTPASQNGDEGRSLPDVPPELTAEQDRDDAKRELGRYYRSLADRFLESHPDPKAARPSD